MRCSKCGSDNREGRKFCTNCGAPLIVSCSKCGALVEPGGRFCGECGAAISASAPTAPSSPQPRPLQLSDAILATEVMDGERKTVTALFADIKGSMELMEGLDPEEARAIIEPVVKLMIEALRHYDGYMGWRQQPVVRSFAYVNHPLRPQRRDPRFGCARIPPGVVPALLWGGTTPSGLMRPEAALPD